MDNLPLSNGQIAVEARQTARKRLFNHLASYQSVYEKHLQRLQELQERIEVHPNKQS